MLSIANKVFRDFKEFYNEINAATLTGAIDVVVVEQPDGSFLCSPFHVRFGKLGVLRSREKIVDIEINGDVVDIHMKLGESGEAFFVEECTEGDLEELPHMATSPIPSSEMTNFEETITIHKNDIKIPLPRRNSVDLGTKESNEDDQENKFENQVSDYSQRRHTDNDLVRRDLSINKLEFTTQRLRQEFPEEQEQLYDEIKEKFNLRRLDESQQFRPIDDDKSQLPSDLKKEETEYNKEQKETIDLLSKDENKTSDKAKKKRRKKSTIKKKNSIRKSSTSSSTGSADVAVESEVVENVSGSSNENSPNNDIVKGPITNEISEKRRELNIHFFSDGEAMSPQGSRPNTPIQSDTEFEVSQREKCESSMTSSASWKWGEPVISDEHQEQSINSETNKRNSMLSGMLSFMKQKRKSVPDGLYLSDLDLVNGLDPEVAAMYFPKSNEAKICNKPEEDRESGNGTSLPQSPTTSVEVVKSDSDYEEKHADSSLNFVALSLCGGMERGGPTEEEFNKNSIQYSDICINPTLFSSPNLVVRLNNKYYSWMQACPIVMTLLAYQKPLPNEVFEKLSLIEPEKVDVKGLHDHKDSQQVQAVERRGWFSWRRSGGSVQEPQKKTPDKISKTESIDGVSTSPQSSPSKFNDQNNIGCTSLSSDDSFQFKKYADDMSVVSEKFRKTLRLSSHQIESLNLKSGMNEVEFSVTTAYQGTSRCKCYLFKWKYNDKVVISDIDGTITKSDVLGHILPMVGRDWAQIGVAQLFSKIEENGYKMLYLSARAIGQSRATREYLRSIRQGDVQLPDGPLLLNPTSLISALHREVIERKPEQFKIECLSDIKSLFQNKNPFYAGYGNRINDVWAYRAVGIPIERIYTINPRGELKHELTQTFQSTYCSMTYIVDLLFPPIKVDEEEEDCFDSFNFNSFNYWRDPISNIIDMEISRPNSPIANESLPLPPIPEA